MSSSVVVETCVDTYVTTCQWTADETTSSCSTDSFGKACSCCVNGTYSGDTGTCTSTDSFWMGSNDIAGYSQGQILKISLLLLSLMIFY